MQELNIPQTLRPPYPQRGKQGGRERKGPPEKSCPEISSQKVADFECGFPYDSYGKNRAPFWPFLGEGFWRNIRRPLLLWPLCFTAEYPQTGLTSASLVRENLQGGSGTELEPEPEPFFPKPKAEPEPPEPFSRNRNRNQNRPFLLNCTEAQKTPFCRGTAGTENRNRSNRSNPQTVTEPNRTGGLPKIIPNKFASVSVCLRAATSAATWELSPAKTSFGRHE